MKAYKLLVTILCLVVIVSCEEEVFLDLEVKEQKLVIEGRVVLNNARKNEPQTIVLSQLGEFFVNEETPRATGAKVWVTDGAGNRYDYAETSPGNYINNDLIGEIGETYTLRINWNNEEFEAIETLIAVPRIDNIYQVFEEENLFEDEGIKIAIDFTDPTGVNNYYLWETFKGDELQILPDAGNKFNLVGEDEDFDGQEIIGYFPNEEIVFDPGDVVTVKQWGISEAAFNYYFTLFDQSGRFGGVLDTPPIGVKGNIKNLTNPDNSPLGYFFAAQVSESTYIIRDER